MGCLTTKEVSGSPCINTIPVNQISRLEMWSRTNARDTYLSWGSIPCNGSSRDSLSTLPFLTKQTTERYTVISVQLICSKYRSMEIYSYKCTVNM